MIYILLFSFSFLLSPLPLFEKGRQKTHNNNNTYEMMMVMRKMMISPVSSACRQVGNVSVVTVVGFSLCTERFLGEKEKPLEEGHLQRLTCV